jgi:hypothetical protein
MSLGESTSAVAEKPVTTDPVRCTYYQTDGERNSLQPRDSPGYFAGTSEGPASSLDCVRPPLPHAYCNCSQVVLWT